MSNFLAIATVTASLSQVLQDAVQVDVSGADVKTVRPDKDVPAKGVNIYLYQVTPNAAWRNTDLPTRRQDGQLAQRPRAALDLHYLLTFYGEESLLEPQRLLGSVVRTLHERSTLSRQRIRNTITNPTFSPFLGTSNLADEIELVKFTPLTLALEDLSKIWSAFLKTEFTLSVAYMGTLVLIDSDEAPNQALPVRERRIAVVPFSPPAISAVEPQIVEASGGATITLRGRSLLGEDTLVQFGELDQAPGPESTGELLTVALPAGLRAGVNTVQVVHRLDLGLVPPTERKVFESNVAAFVVRPSLTSATFASGGPLGRRVTVVVSPAVGPRQRATLLLNQIADPTVTFSVAALPRELPTDPLVFSAAGVPAATYLVRVRIDGAESAMTVDPDVTNPRYTGPTVIVT